jgi:hypothetical protein
MIKRMNYTGIFSDPSGIIGYLLETFTPMNPYFWVLFFVGVIGYVYLALQSITATIIVILITFGIFGGTSISGYFAAVPVINQLLYIITLFGLMLLIGTFVMKRR